MSAKKLKPTRTLSLGFDPGYTNAGFAYLNVETKECTTCKVNLRLKNTDHGWKNEKVTENNMERWIEDFLKAFNDVFERAYVMGIENPQKRPIFTAMAWILKYKVTIAYPHIKVFMVDPKQRTRFYKSSGSNYDQRKDKSLVVFKHMVGTNTYESYEKRFGLRLKPTKRNKLGTKKILADPAEAVLYAWLVHKQYKELDKVKKPNFEKEAPYETSPIHTFTFTF